MLLCLVSVDLAPSDVDLPLPKLIRSLGLQAPYTVGMALHTVTLRTPRHTVILCLHWSGLLNKQLCWHPAMRMGM